jgi:hypothetical protein
MSDQVLTAQVAANAASVRVALEPGSAERIGGAVAPMRARYGAANLAVPFEIEPMSYAVVQRGEIGR